jgi:hypothetical protein
VLSNPLPGLIFPHGGCRSSTVLALHGVAVHPLCVDFCYVTELQGTAGQIKERPHGRVYVARSFPAPILRLAMSPHVDTRGTGVDTCPYGRHDTSGIRHDGRRMTLATSETSQVGCSETPLQRPFVA